MVEEMTIAELMEEECTEENEEEEYEEIGFDEEEDDEEEDCYGEIAKTITTEIAQPIKTTVRVGAEKDSKGNVKPNCSFSIERNLTEDVDEFKVIENDFDALIERVKVVMESFKEE